jgi:glutamyl-tRNA reductase
MEFAVIGVSHKEATVQIRGQVAFTTLMKEAATTYFEEVGLQEFMIISTCNRSEVYIGTRDMNHDIEIVRKYYTRLAGQGILPYLFVKKYEVALQHIYQVAAGLSSLVVGEDQILGQMKDALAFGIDHHSCKKYMTKVVRESITFSKKIRTAYKLSENQLSVASIGVQYLKTLFGSLKKVPILLVGTGSMGRLILTYLEEAGVTDIYLTNRTYNKEKFDFEIGPKVKIVPYEARYDYLEKVEVVISATASPHVIFEASRMEHLLQPLTLLDMAVPRDIDPEIDALLTCKVITLDDFLDIANKHMEQRHELAQQINRLILEEVKELELWLLRSKVDGVIHNLHKKQKSVVEEALEQAKKELNLSVEQEKALALILSRSTKAMIKAPIAHLKKLEEEEDIDRYKMVIEKLFDMEGSDH